MTRSRLFDPELSDFPDFPDLTDLPPYRAPRVYWRFFVGCGKQGTHWVYVAQRLCRFTGCAIRGDNVERVRFIVSNEPWPSMAWLPASPFLAAHDLMRKTGSFPAQGALDFRPLSMGQSVVVETEPDTAREVIFFGAWAL